MCTKIKNTILTLTLIIGISLSFCNHASKKDDAPQEQTSPKIEATDTQEEIAKDDFSKISLYHHANALSNGNSKSIDWLKENSPVLYHHANVSLNYESKSFNWLKQNNINLYHHANAFVNQNSNSFKFLKK